MKNKAKLLILSMAVAFAVTGCSLTGATEKEPVSVTWDDCVVNPSKSISDDAIIEFTLADGTGYTDNIGSYSYIEALEYNDLDNDGEDEYVFRVSFSNTLSEYELLRVYKIVDGKVEKLFPDDTGIKEVDENAVWEEQTVVQVDGATKNAIKVQCYIKEDGVGKLTYEGIIYYDNGQWNEYTE